MKRLKPLILVFAVFVAGAVIWFISLPSDPYAVLRPFKPSEKHLTRLAWNPTTRTYSTGTPPGSNGVAHIFRFPTDSEGELLKVLKPHAHNDRPDALWLRMSNGATGYYQYSTKTLYLVERDQHWLLVKVQEAKRRLGF